MTQIRTIRSRAPMRISFGGGGSEIDPYRSYSGGRVMNSTISMYAHTVLSDQLNNQIIIQSSDTDEIFNVSTKNYLAVNFEDTPKSCVLALAVLKYFSQELNCTLSQGIKITTYSDAPVGSGLGASSTMTVAIVHALLEYFKLPSDPYSLATIAHKIEREYLGLAGGIQDHFCAAFGGFNFMEFGPADHLLINPLRIKDETLFELESSLILIYTGTSRESAQIIQNQISAMNNSDRSTGEILDKIAENAILIKSSILKWNLGEFATLLNEGWRLKKLMTETISNNEINRLGDLCTSSGALGSKLCGAGGGGYLLVAIKPEHRRNLMKALGPKSEGAIRITFVNHGSEVWHSTSA
jgi:D-glycero-alpha-D-manno-heptose-7-phosphate kinase